MLLRPFLSKDGHWTQERPAFRPHAGSVGTSVQQAAGKMPALQVNLIKLQIDASDFADKIAENLSG